MFPNGILINAIINSYLTFFSSVGVATRLQLVTLEVGAKGALCSVLVPTPTWCLLICDMKTFD